MNALPDGSADVRLRANPSQPRRDHDASPPRTALMRRVLALLLAGLGMLAVVAPTAGAQAAPDGGATVERQLYRSTNAHADILVGTVDPPCYTSVYLDATQGVAMLSGPPQPIGFLYLSIDNRDCSTGSSFSTSFINENLPADQFTSSFPRSARLTTSAVSYEGLYTVDIDVTWTGQGPLPPPQSGYTWRQITPFGTGIDVQASQGREAPAVVTGTITVRSTNGSMPPLTINVMDASFMAARLLSTQFLHITAFRPQQ